MVWRVFAFVIGLLTLSVSAILAIGSRDTVSLGVPIVAAAGATVCLGLARALQLRAFRAIQLTHVLASTAQQGHRVLNTPPGRDPGPGIPLCHPCGRPSPGRARWPPSNRSTYAVWSRRRHTPKPWWCCGSRSEPPSTPQTRSPTSGAVPT
jgi:hypothetical protein